MIDDSRYDCDFTLEEQAEASEKHFADLEEVHGEQRLTEKFSKYEGYVKVEEYIRQIKKDDDLFNALSKLAHYEDLEEQGRLVVLPEGFDFEKLCEAVGAEDSCPEHFGLKKTRTCGNINCKECWETALKGE